MTRTRRGGRRLGAIVVSCVAFGALVAVPTTTPADATPTCVSTQLQRAPVVAGDVRDDGSPVVATKDRRGKQVPIVLVPGAGAAGTVSTTSRTGPFAHPVDLSAGTPTVAKAPRSLLGELQNLPGTDVFTFNYSKWAGAWVDDSHLGPALGSALACLRQATGEPAVVVTDSTGSLVARWAVTHPGLAGADPASVVSTVVTFGSPDAGSTLGLLASGGVAAAERAGLTQAASIAATVRLLAAGCAAATAQPADGSVCDELDRTVPLAVADIGRALTAGSTQLAALRAWPAGVTVRDLHASTSLTLPAHGWFGSPADTAALAVGDLSDLTAALPKAQQAAASCAVTLAGSSDVTGWTLASTGSDDPGRPAASATSPCLAGDLTRATELVADARTVVLADLFRRQPLTAEDLLSAPIPPLCDGFWPAGQLTNGAYAGPNPDPNGDAEPPTLGVLEQRSGAMQVFGDLDGDGIGDAASVVDCNQGGVSWPDNVVLWGSGLRLLGAFYLGDLLGDAREGTRSLTYSDGKIAVDSIDARPWDAGCCASGLAKVTLGFNGSAVTADDVQHLQGPFDYTFSGIGDVKIGMSPSELAAVGAKPDATGGTTACSYYATSDGVTATVDNETGKVIKVGLAYGTIQSPHTYPEGVGVGSTLAEVYAAYRDHEIENHLDGSFGQGLNGILVKGDGGYLGFSTQDDITVSDVDISDGKDYGALEYCSG